MAATTIGNTKGILGVSTSGTITGLIIHSVSTKSGSEVVDFVNADGDITATAYFNHTADVSIKGELLSGTSMTQTVAAALTLTLPLRLPAGYTSGGTLVCEEITVNEAIKEWQNVDISARYLPKTVTGA